jgi:hypothetical protein
MCSQACDIIYKSFILKHICPAIFENCPPLEKDILSIPHSGSGECGLVSVVIVGVIIVKRITIV